tara:strand:+ start:987 stop:1532 length:546 start_codon:yes stop_codon:yes gene_type:complete
MDTMGRAMDFKVATLLKASSGNKKLESVSSTIKADWSEFKCDVDGSVLLTKTDVGVWVSACLSAKIGRQCGNCLDQYVESIGLGIEEEYFPLVDLVTGERNELEGSSEDNFYIGEDNVLDLSDVVLQYVSLHSSINSKCKDYCKGLCIDCGINLNKEKCNCRNNYKNTKLAALLESFRPAN